MTGANDPSGGPAGQSGRRRPPTIDLKATEVAGGPEAATGAAGPQGPEAAAAGGPSSSTAPGRHPALGWLPPGFPWPLAAAGGAGAALMLAALALGGAFSGRDHSAAVADPRLARLEQQVRDLAARPLPVASDPRAVDDLAGRLARLETVIATPRPPITDPALANRLATLEGEIRALGERIGVLARRNDEIASIAGDARTRADMLAAAVAELRKLQAAPAAPVVGRADVDAVAARLVALEQTMKAIEAAQGTRAGSDGGTDRALRLVVVARALDAAVERGMPFAGELAAARNAAADPKVLAPLDPFAAAGLPGAAALARDLAALVPVLAKTVGTTPRDGGILDRLKANAEKIVRVRPLDEAVGDDPAAVVRRIETRAGQSDLVGAMAEIARLPEPARDLAKAWIARVEARNAALAASRRFAASALAALGKPSL